MLFAEVLIILLSRTIAGVAHPIQHKLQIPAHVILDMFLLTINVWAVAQLDMLNRLEQIIALKIHVSTVLPPVILLIKFAHILAVWGIYFTKEIV